MKKIITTNILIFVTIIGCIFYYYVIREKSETLTSSQKLNIVTPSAISESNIKEQNKSYPPVIIGDPLLELDAEMFEREYAKLPDDYEIETGLDPDTFQYIFGVKIKKNKITKKRALQITAAYPDDEIIEIYSTAMKLSWKGIRFFPNIKSIGWYGSEIKDVSELEYLSNLEHVDIHNCNLYLGTSTEDLQGLAKMKEYNIYLTHCNLPNIDFMTNFSGINKKSTIALNSNLIKNISPLNSIKEIEKLSISGNQIEDISPLSNLKYAKSLFLDDNQITDISPLANLMEVSYLSLSGNNITDLSMLNSQLKVDNIQIQNNKIMNINRLFKLPTLKHINVKG
ncbi:MAG: hypothetical protein LBR68_03310, partial [Lachnoclostridium sp.]|nr:hypothetical protein [Lachnoclostridium sp.]